MKNFKKLSALMVALVMIFTLAACGSSDVKGTWTAEQNGVSVTYTFEKDGKGTCKTSGISVDITYVTSGSQLTINAEVGSENTSQTLVYSISGDTLSLTSEGTTVNFTKQK